ncbi:hypothetical protein EUGRSUZ_E03830 [Eucalyptus grandis]|uniref:Uncharacterized protein n=2 Tax=Eucalyptus grandis TaxID=71139 RepID=A0ACC3L1G0_EUCGR|nr:hypothetical protein EUGRSUZ_E03830 [Eucalyptus grandis]
MRISKLKKSYLFYFILLFFLKSLLWINYNSFKNCLSYQSDKPINGVDLEVNAKGTMAGPVVELGTFFKALTRAFTGAF